MIIRTLLRESYQKKVKYTHLSFNNHYDLKCCHCFSHHKTIAIKGSRRDFWFLLPHLRGHMHAQCTHAHTDDACCGGRAGQ